MANLVRRSRILVELVAREAERPGREEVWREQPGVLASGVAGGQ
jgi:hypothetical protein